MGSGLNTVRISAFTHNLPKQEALRQAQEVRYPSSIETYPLLTRTPIITIAGILIMHYYT